MRKLGIFLGFEDLGTKPMNWKTHFYLLALPKQTRFLMD